MAYITAHSCRIIVRPALRRKQPELLECGVILLQDNAAPHNHHVQNLAQCWGWEVLAHPLYSTDPALRNYWLVACVKEHLQGKQFELGEDINTAIIASLHHLTMDKY
jgi:hypothetical protein